MNSPTCITSKDQCELNEDTCCYQGLDIPCLLPRQGDMSIMTGGGTGEPFCDEFYNTFYGYVEEMRLYCGSTNRAFFVEGFKTRYGRRPGSNVYAWTNIHGGKQYDSRDR